MWHMPAELRLQLGRWEWLINMIIWWCRPASNVISSIVPWELGQCFIGLVQRRPWRMVGAFAVDHGLLASLGVAHAAVDFIETTVGAWHARFYNITPHYSM